MTRVLVAGIGNIFLGDDGFGVEVVRRLAAESLGDSVVVADFGIRGIHLAYELAGGAYDAAILVDAIARGGEPGTLYTLEPQPDLSAQVDSGMADAHALTPDALLAWLHRAGGADVRIIIVGCEPAELDESMEISPRVAASVDNAVALIRDLVREIACGAVRAVVDTGQMLGTRKDHAVRWLIQRRHDTTCGSDRR
jgi:hydrogenase maturation protease